MLELENAQGQTLTIADPANSLGATLTKSVTAGTYYLVVRSSGGYGDLGRYSLHGEIAGPISTPSQPLPQPQRSPTNLKARVILARASPAKDCGRRSHRLCLDRKLRKLTGARAMQATRSGPPLAAATTTWTFTGLASGQYRLAGTWMASGLNAASAGSVLNL